MPLPTVAAGLVAGFLAYAVERGVDLQTLAERVGVSTLEFDDLDRRVPLALYADLVRGAKALADDPALALRHGEDVGMSQVSMTGLIMEAAETMGEAFAQLQRYGRLAVELDDGSASPRFALVASEGLFLVDRRTDPNSFPELSEMAFARLACGPRRFLQRAHVLGVHFTHAAPPYGHEYDRIFRSPMHFGSHWNALELHPEIAGWKVSQNPRYIFGVLVEKADSLLVDLNAENSVRSKLEALLLRELHQGDVGADEIAMRLGVSRMTLFRRLRREGTTFAAVRDELRQRMAMQYLAGRKVSVSETAYLVGFSEPAAFSRAFRRWTGLPPSEFSAPGPRV
jgi:AraC-like DNA-binding protein